LSILPREVDIVSHTSFAIEVSVLVVISLVMSPRVFPVHSK
jgi:hypothetical protein